MFALLVRLFVIGLSTLIAIETRGLAEPEAGPGEAQSVQK